mgnify:FL=1
MSEGNSYGVKRSALEELKLRGEKERSETEKALADVMQFLSHDTSPTRLQLALALRQRAEVIEAEAGLDRFVCDYSG